MVLMQEPMSVLSHTVISLIIVAPLMVILAAIAAVAYCFFRNKRNKRGHGTFSINPNYRPYSNSICPILHH